MDVVTKFLHPISYNIMLSTILLEKVTDETRNVLVESARIARGNIQALSAFNSNQFDALIFPGGSGCAKNLSTYAFDGADCTVNKDVEKAVKEMVSANKPIGALCIAPRNFSKNIKNG